MATVSTVLGPVDTRELGFTLSHEHIATGSAGMRHTYPEFFDREGTIEDAAAALKQAYDEGVRSYIDPTTFDLGRDIEMMQEVSRRSGVHIIPATGSHQAIPRVFRSASPDAIAPLYIREVEEGIEGTSVKAAIIKSASDQGGITELEEVVLRAVARASKHTGAPVYTHTWSPDRVGEQQIRVLEEEGVDLERVYIGHSNDTHDVDYILGLLRKGVWVGLDRFPGGRYPGVPLWQERTEIVKRLIDEGWAHRIMLGHDHSVPRGQPTPEMREQRANYQPEGYSFISRRVLPYLRELGTSEEDIQTIMVDNPRRFLEGN
ncbi:MAG TPA: phosphotriesterase-related protein [Dehalococcoidia bacterium]|jgi:phosphotriesterase-related protein|nr:phosphotriesterase-related protein [Dehalococcoidia bacterium]